MQACLPSLHPHPSPFSPGWFHSRTISFGSRGSPVPDIPAFLTGTKSPVLLRTLPKASEVRALCPLVSGVGSFWRQRGRPSAVCPLPRALQSRALSCPSPVGEKGGLRQPHAGVARVARQPGSASQEGRLRAQDRSDH